MPGSGSGMPGTVPPMPPGGSGSGMPPMPPGGSGYGGGCASGFLKVCPEMNGFCPYDSMPVCPAPTMMPMASWGRSLDRMNSQDGCECVPMVLMQMVMTQQEVMDRAGGDFFEDESVKVGKKTCTCDFTFTVANNGKAKGTGSCDKKCSGKVTEMTLAGEEYEYTFGFSSKKGKVKMGKVTVIELGGSTGGSVGGGSGMPGGGVGSGCVCVFGPEEIGGSGMPPLPPTMPPSGSGSGMPPLPSTMPPGGSGSGMTPLPPTMPPSGSGSGMTPMPPGGSGSEFPGETAPPMPPTGSGSGSGSGSGATPLPPLGGNGTGETLGLGLSFSFLSLLFLALFSIPPHQKTKVLEATK